MLREAELPVLYADEWLAAVAKPCGLLAHRSLIAPGENDVLLTRLRAQFGRRVFLPHRLDRATSGVVLVAFGEEMARALGRDFAERRVEKRYLAFVRGWFEPPEGAIDRPLEVPGRGLRPALTHYRTLAQAELPIPTPPHPTTRWSLVEARPETGRYHQIRRHFKHANHPVLGDTTHGDARHNRLLRSFGIQRLMLHALSLDFVHPATGEPLRLDAPLDESWFALAERLGLRLP
ncbi:MAG: tRNA pseudouridine synthase C [Lysobacterales bacterium]|jgi:tRNA pseudouridine65 synthase|nr:MAG: tRNA pseudouridine synthase C [Xanthomonadales bacterium]